MFLKQGTLTTYVTNGESSVLQINNSDTLRVQNSTRKQISIVIAVFVDFGDWK